MTVAAIPFYAAGLIAVPTGWKRVKGPGIVPGWVKERFTAEDEHGDEQEDHATRQKFEGSEDFVCNNNTNVIPPDLGVLDATVVTGGGVTLTGISIQTETGYAKMTIKYVVFTTTDIAPKRKYTHGITLAACKGPTDFMSGTANTDPVTKLISGSIDISCSPSDDNFDGAGDYFGHEVHSGRISASTVWKGAPTTPAGAGWLNVTQEPDTTPSTHLTITCTGNKKMASVAVV